MAQPTSSDAVYRANRLAPESPWNCWEVDELGPNVMKFMEDQEAFFARWAEVWYQNFQFIYGNQSVRWSRRYGYAVDSDFLRREPSVSQKAQTNLARTVCEALASLIYSNLPGWDVDAATESSTKGKRFKRIVQKLLDAYMVRLSMDKEFQTAALIYTGFGQVGAWIDWNALGGQLLEIPKWKKVQAPLVTDFMAPNPVTGGLLEVPAPMMGADGMPSTEERWEAVVDQMGKQVIDRLFAGDVKVDMLTPFEYRREIGSHGTHKTKYIQRIRLLDYDDYLDEYGTVPGKTKYFDKVRPVYDSPAIYKIAVRHFMRMQFTTPPSVGDSFGRPQSAYKNGAMKNKVLVVEHWDKPHPVKWKKGRRLVIVNGDCTHVTEPSYTTNKMDGWHPLCEAQWLNMAPSSIATGPMNDVIAKNRELNIADSLVATAMRRNMGSQLLLKTGSGLDPQKLTGEPGKVHEVMDPYGARWLHDDMPIPPVISTIRESIKEDVYETSGAQDALRGERSEGAPSGYAQRQIEEREQKRLAPARKTFGAFAKGIGEKLWCCLKTNVVKLDDDVMGFLVRSGAGEFQPQDVVALLSEPVDFGIEINIVEESMSIKSKATQQATLIELSQGPAGVRLQNPKVLDEFLKYFDADKLTDSSTKQRDRAQRENEVFTDMLRLGPQAEGIQKPVVFFEDDDQIHIEEHTDFFLENSDEIMRNEAFLTEWLLHLETHRLQDQEKQAQLPPGASLQVPAMQQMAMQQPPPTMQTTFQGVQAMSQAQAKSGGGGTPNSASNGAKAPSQPAPPGSGGPPQTGTQTPSANTPSAAAQGGKPA